MPSSVPDDHLDASLDPADQVGALLLTLMSRLLATRGVGVLAEAGGLRVVAAKGRVGVEVGAPLGVPPDALDGVEWEEAGLTLAIPLRHGSEVVGLVALGPRATGVPYSPAEIGVARSLAGATAASVRAGQVAGQLVEANRQQRARAQELRTLFELSQAFGRALDADAILNRLGFALMGQLLVSRFAVALCDSDRDEDGMLDVTFGRGGEGAPAAVPCALADLDAPEPVDAASELGRDGWRWAVPLRAGDVSRGVILLGPRATGEFDARAADFAAALAALAVGALETADRVAERLDRERIREEVRLAREVQTRLLPARLPTLPGLDVAARWRPSRDVSGDTYEVCDLGHGRLLVAVADVVGKGIGASLLMATLQAGFRLLQPDLERESPDLAAATARLDRLVHQSTEATQFVTLAWGIADANDGTFRFVVAGHPPPRLLRADGRVEPLTCGGPLLGVIPGARFVQGEVRLGLGDAVLLYTDGATEAQDAAGEELDVPGLDRALSPAPSADALLDAVVAAIDEWAAGGGGDDDDLTLVAVRRAGPGEG